MVASKKNGLAKGLGDSGAVKEEGDSTSYEVHLEAVIEKWAGKG